MTVSGYRHLFQPLRVGPLTLRNRIVFSAHLTNYAQDGLPSAQHAAYYAARAAGGAGLIITEEHSTHPTDWPYEKLIHGFSPAVIPGYRRITSAVHAHGVPILAQLNHNGGQASGMYSRLPVWAPSPVPDPLFREVPKAVEPTEIAEIVAGYGLVAGHCAEGGFDGVELQCSHSSIVRGFLSPATNHRTDGYGGPLRNRARVLLEIIDVVRAAIGPGRVLGVRICGDELIENGITVPEAVEVAAMAEATGKVDYINTSIGVATATLYMIEASMRVPPGYAMFIPAAIRQAVSLPVVGVGRFKDPLQADRALAAGQCDLVGVVRGQIADPDFAAKARAGHAAHIRTCLSCNQECVGRMGLNRWLGCIENPRTGKESAPLPPPAGLPTPAALSSSAQSSRALPSRALPSGAPSSGAPSSGAPSSGAPSSGADRPPGRRVYVVGGGPGGLQTAVTAASRGHHVTLFERDERTGGQVNAAAAVPSRAEFADLTRNLAAEAARAGVNVKTGHEVDAAFLLGEGPDAVVLATGARPALPGWSGGHPRVTGVREVLAGTVSPAGSVIVVDELGFHQATSAAELLAGRGCAVEVITSGMVVGQDLGITLDLELWTVKARSLGVRQRTDVVVLGSHADAGGRLVLELLHHPTGVAGTAECDWVVCAIPPEPEDGLWHALAGAPFGVHRVGDCLAPRRAHAAVVEGERVGAVL